MLYCKHCGYKVIKNSRFCMNCCSPLDEEGVIHSTEIDDRLDNLYIAQTESQNDFFEYDIFNIDIKNDDSGLRPTFKAPRKRLRDLFKSKNKLI